jgi:Mannosyltransferase putative
MCPTAVGEAMALELRGGLLLAGGKPAIPPPHSEAEMRWHVNELRRQAARLFPQPETLAGDGIVVVAFGPRYKLMAMLAARMLRAVSDLPMQIWHDGTFAENEVPGVTCIDVRNYWSRFPHPKGGWPNKIYAIRHCGFRRAILIDADAYFTRDPRPLFALLEQAPVVYWGKHGGLINWPAFGVDGSRIPQMTGGQVMIDIERAWRFVNVATWINAHHDYYYDYGYGDEDTYHAAVVATETPSLCLGTWSCPLAACLCEWQGKVWIVHRLAKLFSDQVPHWDRSLPAEEQVIELFRELNAAGYRKAAFAPCTKRRSPGGRQRR